MSEFIVKMTDLGNDEQAFRFPITAEWLKAVLSATDVDASSEQCGEINLRLVRSGPDIIVQGTATAKLIVECARCLGEVRVEVTADLTMLMSPGDDPSEDEDMELDADELGHEYFTGDQIVFDSIVRDYLVLELPMQPKCIDPPCPQWAMKHIDTTDGKSTSDDKPEVDPRLAPLAALKDKLSN